MIAVRIRGGLGNQLFQYACGRAQALRLGTELALDLRDWNSPRPFDFGLRHFDIQVVDPVGLPMARGDGLWRTLAKAFSASRMGSFREKGMAYDPRIREVRDHTLLKGYWQSEKYFADKTDQIRRDLRIVTPPGPETARLMDEIAEAPAVSLHVRRGDYVTNTKYNAAHGTTGLEFYTQAMERIAEATGTEPVVYAFSDDADWVRDNLALPFEMRVVSHNDGATAHDDLRLMSACRHHVIANSTFSWWGAWLNPSPEKIVIAPKRWYADPLKVNPDITPDSWIRL